MEGTSDFPMSLVRYLFASDNPVNASDPSGLYTTTEGKLVERQIYSQYVLSRLLAGGRGEDIRNGREDIRGGTNVIIGRSGRKVMPDIQNHTLRRYMEVKSLSPTGIRGALSQMSKYAAELTGWKPDQRWQPPIPIFWLDETAQLYMAFNVKGVIFYTSDLALYEYYVLAAAGAGGLTAALAMLARAVAAKPPVPTNVVIGKFAKTAVRVGETEIENDILTDQLEAEAGGGVAVNF